MIRAGVPEHDGFMRITLTSAMAVLAGSALWAADITHIGRATVEYRDDDLRVVAGYDYSQREHAEPWLLFEVGVTAQRDRWPRPDAFALLLPDGRVLDTPTQAEWRRGRGEATAMLQRARPLRNSVVDSAFGCAYPARVPEIGRRSGGLGRDACDYRAYWTLQGRADRYVAVNRLRAARVDVLFESPYGDDWPAGEYVLLVRGDGEPARLPVALQ